MNEGGSLTAALLQLNVSDDPDANLAATIPMIREAAAKGARFVLTPEVTNVLSPDRKRQAAVLKIEGEDQTLAALRAEAKAAGIWLLIGSLALKGNDPADERFVNRSLLIDPQGEISARYDKLHMFDVTISESETYRESASYKPGGHAVMADIGDQKLGMTICYDLRFPYLYRHLAQSGARILSIPSAFNATTGKAHWESLLRARAIETGCFVLAPAQCGTHPAPHSPDRTPRQSYGHSLAVDPWGEVLADGGVQTGVTMVTLDLTATDRARSRIPSLMHDRSFTGP